MNNSVRNGTPVITLLDKLSQCNASSEIIYLFKEILHVLCSAETERNHFYLCRGVQKILVYLDHVDQDVSDHAFYILGYAASQHAEIKKSLTTRAVFDRLSQVVAAQQCSCSLALFLLAMVTAENSLAQEFVRESGCLSRLLHLFLLMSQDCFHHDWNGGSMQQVVQDWSILCTVLSVSLGPAFTHVNQAEARIILPQYYLSKHHNKLFSQAVGLLNFWNSQLEYNKYLMHWMKLVAWLVATVISGNAVNQEQFFWLNGITAVIRALNQYEKLGICQNGFQFRMLCLLDAALYGNERNCKAAGRLSVVPLMLQTLREGDSKVIVIVLMILTHLIESCPIYCSVFIQKGGLEIVAGILQKAEGNTDITMAAHVLVSQYVRHFIDLTESSTKLGRNITDENRHVGCTMPLNSQSQSVNLGEHAGNISHERMTFKGKVPLLVCSSVNKSISEKFGESVKHVGRPCSCASQHDSFCELTGRGNCVQGGLDQCDEDTAVVSTYGGHSFGIFGRLKSVFEKLFSCKKESHAVSSPEESISETCAGGSASTSSLCQQCKPCNVPQHFLLQHSVGSQTSSICMKRKKCDMKYVDRNKVASERQMLPPKVTPKKLSSCMLDLSCNRGDAVSVASSTRGNMEYNVWQSRIATNSTSTPLKVLATPSKSHKDQSFHTSSTSSANSDRLVCIRKFSEDELENLFRGVELHGLNFRAILAAFPFHPKRTSRELYLKWRSIKTQTT